MRPPPLIVLLAGCLVFPAFLISVFSLFARSSRQHTSGAHATSNRPSGFRALFSFHTPSSLFPPSALISLTDDNSTFFLARPAAFGPLLPSEGFSGQLWVGSGFGDDFARRGGGSALGADGELGCSDLPDWGDNNGDPASEESSRRVEGAPSSAQDPPSKKDGINTKFGDGQADDAHNSNFDDRTSEKSALTPSEDDGTDDHLHHPRPGTDVLKPKGSSRDGQNNVKPSKGRPLQHADIQSIQEGAEISGKIVLLSRGGCGFLEKAKWVQRRGGMALIVGDDTRGGALFTMYASGDTSNITIPSLFTSHTTAQLLTSLMSPNRYGDSRKLGGSASRSKDGSSNARLGGKLKDGKIRNKPQGPTFTPTTSVVRSTSTPTAGSGKGDLGFMADSPFQVKEKESWLHSFLSSLGIRSGSSTPSDLGGDSRRPPTSGQLDWVLVDEWTEDDLDMAEEQDTIVATTTTARSKSTTKSRRPTPTPSHPGKGDDFVIGVQDWRDPDLVGAVPSKDASSTKKSRPSKSAVKGAKSPSETKGAKDSSRGDGNRQDQGDAPKGGSITPGSGQYGKLSKETKMEQPSDEKQPASDQEDDSENDGWFGGLSWSQDEDEDSYRNEGSSGGSGLEASGQDTDHVTSLEKVSIPDADEHEGLWVTLTPTSMSSSPFFDTLLVLVVSPLVTLTVVYALLLLRSRIRRRRWRAPKAVVERLPVRTYHTLSSPTSPMSTRYATPHATSPGSPLLQSTEASRPRPRSQTTSAVQSEADVTRSRPIVIPDTPPTNEAEKPSMASSEWRRRYTGKQVECVVCLEEYVDGISRVMSLPCGHEFHADCITPWLTTRRRTCPICKGDVVRSLAHTSSPTTSAARYHDDPEDDAPIPTTNESRRPMSSLGANPTSDRTAEDHTDLERGTRNRIDAPLVTEEPSPWAQGMMRFQGGVRRLSDVIGVEREERRVFDEHHR
ncbi:MAG: Para-hydroxybenzoate--polyprenyltransferase, mitochondrial precursor (PHB:polyprenyltransferase) [Chaenotheca gracillima]|nr:MAG: Para-hydroxybenzoate--polyprenyltransferase, mitochondrial precursor (PHB:polyprenyltransferase) [Chaenotheca gracillima]